MIFITEDVKTNKELKCLAPHSSVQVSVALILGNCVLQFDNIDWIHIIIYQCKLKRIVSNRSTDTAKKVLLAHTEKNYHTHLKELIEFYASKLIVIQLAATLWKDI